MLRRQERSRAAPWLSGVALLLSACASVGGGEGLGTAVPIAEISSVAGRWDGLMRWSSGRRDEDFIEMTLNPDGSYRATTARVIGVVDAQGRMELRDGRLLLRGERSSGTATLYARDGRRTLVVVMTTMGGEQLSARLTPKP
jgi:hypothetical protein